MARQGERHGWRRIKKTSSRLVDFLLSNKPSKMAERTGLEPATPGVTGRYSNRLNYRSAPIHCSIFNWVCCVAAGIIRIHRRVVNDFFAAFVYSLIIRQRKFHNVVFLGVFLCRTAHFYVARTWHGKRIQIHGVILFREQGLK